MRRVTLLFALTLAALVGVDQAHPAARPERAQAAAAAPFTLSVDSIMRGPKLVGASPSNLRWAPDSSKVYFSWQKPADDRAATYEVSRDGTGLRQLTDQEQRALKLPPSGRDDAAHKRTLLAEGGDIVIYDLGTLARHQLTRTADVESNPRWARHDTAVTFMRGGNLFLMTLNGADPSLVQLTDVVAPAEPAQPGEGRGARGGRGGGAAGSAGSGAQTASEQVIAQEERSLIEHVQHEEAQGRQGGRGGRGGRGGGGPAQPPLPKFQLQARQSVADMELSSDERFVWIEVQEQPAETARLQNVWNYVTTSGYPEMITGRENVGDVQPVRRLAILDLEHDTSVWADGAFAGNERYPKLVEPPQPRVLDWSLPDVSDDGAHGVVAVRSQDNKDRWYLDVDPATGRARILDDLHDDAWIREAAISGEGGGGGRFGGGAGIAWLPDNKRFLFLSEKDGWMHLYSLDATAAEPKAVQLTSGAWEIEDARLSADRTRVFLTTTEVAPGERQFYTMSVDGGPRTRITTMTGGNAATVSPDEKTIALVYSYTNKPPELYLMPFQAGAPATQVTTTPTDEWRSFHWIDPKVITYKARDGALVYARLFTPEMLGKKRDPRHPGVIFVHGAGYLQDAHKYWSDSYYREYMFNNLLASLGYVVLDPDYRASAGYGRDWRTAIYEHMGGKDLDDVVDGAKFLTATEKVDPKRLGVYGGSYGGFLTLMAMFTTPDVFTAGAALRPVSDWTHYNHGYTSDILNLPQNDIDAYRRSSPIYFADGLKGHLLICQGMVDTNVPFQDSVRLVQRLIELRKQNWEFEPFPVENHSFTEETSWASEYSRILKLFEDNLRR